MRDLHKNEQEVIFSILPENKIGYKKYREMISEMKVVGTGRFGDGNFILGKAGTKVDLSIPSTPVFATGTVHLKDKNIDIAIHEVEDDMIEVQVSPDFDTGAEFQIKNVTCYSNWYPGDNSPINSVLVKEYIIKKDCLVLAVDANNKRLWLHNQETGVNHLLPVSNFFNELMRLKRIKDEKRIQNPSSLFERLDEFTSEDIKLTFYQYNKYIRKFNFQLDPVDWNKSKQKKKNLFKIFSRN